MKNVIHHHTETGWTYLHNLSPRENTETDVWYDYLLFFCENSVEIEYITSGYVLDGRFFQCYSRKDITNEVRQWRAIRRPQQTTKIV